MTDPKKTQHPDRRAFERFQIPSAMLKCAKPGFIWLLNKPFLAELLNISARGLRLKTQSPLKAGERLAGRIIVDENKDSVEFSGRVVWVRPLPPQFRGDPTLTIAGVAFDSKDLTREAKIESMRKWFSSTRYKTTRHIV